MKLIIKFYLKYDKIVDIMAETGLSSSVELKALKAVVKGS